MFSAIFSAHISIIWAAVLAVVAFAGGAVALFFVMKNNMSTVKKATAILSDNAKSDAEKLTGVADLLITKVVPQGASVVAIINDKTLSDTQKIGQIAKLLGL
jgi:hypothetical protein